ncbi:MAG: DUF2946 family protein [Burkholderiales bacterium]|nr:DUF2946 family protein [Burkholderiales bacterium]
MHHRRSSQRLTAALAALVMAFASLAPAWAAALKGAQGALVWVEICSATGTQRVAIDASGNAPSPAPTPAQHAGDGKHCPFCGFSPGVLAPPSAPQPSAPLTRERVAVLPALPAAPAAAPVWPPARSRAPPSQA